MRIRDWSSDVCSSDLDVPPTPPPPPALRRPRGVGTDIARCENFTVYPVEGHIMTLYDRADRLIVIDALYRQLRIHPSPLHPVASSCLSFRAGFPSYPPRRTMPMMKQALRHNKQPDGTGAFPAITRSLRELFVTLHLRSCRKSTQEQTCSPLARLRRLLPIALSSSARDKPEDGPRVR